MTSEQWDDLRPELNLPSWERVRHVPYTLERITDEQLRCAVVTLRLAGVDIADRLGYQDLVDEMQALVFGL